MTHPTPMTVQEPVRRAHCDYCGGLGADLQAEVVITPIGTRYRIPLSHESCKRSALSLSLFLGEPAPAVAKRRSRKGVAHEK
jgi:hypothetical protein